jgi:hypothetical protein
MIINTYEVTGTLEKETAYGFFEHRFIYDEIDVSTEQAALDFFEINGWEFKAGVEVRPITEAMKMERAGQPSLFPLSSEGIK